MGNRSKQDCGAVLWISDFGLVAGARGAWVFGSWDTAPSQKMAEKHRVFHDLDSSALLDDLHV